MDNRSFTTWLYSEVAAARCALLTLYEEKDKLQYVDGPRLEKEYMEKLGTFEETVIKEEIECELLKTKQQMIQIAINRHEPIDEAAIDEELNAKRQEKINEAVGAAAPTEFAYLSAEQDGELQELYREIVKSFHPQMHPELTEAHRQLFQKALEAYRRRDLKALKLVHEMLFSTVDSGIPLELMLDFLSSSKDDSDKKDTPRESGFAADYTLAAQIYESFKPISEEAAIREEWTRYRQMTDSVMSEMEQMRSQFPFAAEEMLSDPAKIQEYKDNLSYRLHSATREHTNLTEEIRGMIEGVAAHG